jgi:hypothetical protein
MNLELDKMLNQIRRLWTDKGHDDKDFTDQEIRLHDALEHLKVAADSLSKASQTLMDVLHSK